MGSSSAKKRAKKKILWRDLLKKKWDEVNKIPRKQPTSQCKWIA